MENPAPSTNSTAEGNSKPDTSADPVAALEAQLKEKENRYLYLAADFENFKKRNQKERQDLLKWGWEPVARDLIQVLDNFDRALQHASQADNAVMEGLKMVQKQLTTILDRAGVQKIDTAGQTFDPAFHEAMGQEESDAPVGSILRELVAGYTLHGRLLRPARVTTSKGRS